MYLDHAKAYFTTWISEDWPSVRGSIEGRKRLSFSGLTFRSVALLKHREEKAETAALPERVEAPPSLTS